MYGTEIARITEGLYNTEFVLTAEVIRQNIDTNKSTIKFRAYGYYGGGTSTSSATTGYIKIQDVQVHDGHYTLYPDNNFLGERDIEVVHNADGTCSDYFCSLKVNSYHTSKAEKEAWGSIKPNTIPRYAKITEHKVESTTTNSITVKWATDVPRSWTQYSLNGGAWIDAQDVVATDKKSGHYTIPNLKSGTTYTIKTRVKREGTELWTESSDIKGTTTNNVFRINVKSIWNKGVPYKKINGTWNKGVPYVNDNGTWKKGV